jgi:hypothetical protein
MSTEYVRSIDSLTSHEIKTLLVPYLSGHGVHNPLQVSIERIETIKPGATSLGLHVWVNADEKEFQLFLKLNSGAAALAQVSKRGEQVRELIQGGQRQLEGMPSVHGVFGLYNESVHPLDVTISDAQLEQLHAVLILQDLIDPQQYRPLVDLLKPLGLSTIQTDQTASQTESWVTNGNIASLYESITQNMVQIHRNTNNIPRDVKTRQQLYEEGNSHVLISGERFDGIAGIVPFIPEASAFYQPGMIEELRTRMEALAQRYAVAAQERIREVHGDIWAANRLVGRDGSMFLIDAAPLLCADPAYDVVFAYADLAFLQINRNGGGEFAGEYTQLADTCVHRYTELSSDSEVRRFMSLFYAFKAFVASVFDAGKNDTQRSHLYYSALGVCERALSDPDFEFSFTRLDEYATFGKTLHNDHA